MLKFAGLSILVALLFAALYAPTQYTPFAIVFWVFFIAGLITTIWTLTVGRRPESNPLPPVIAGRIIVRNGEPFGFPGC